MNSAALPELPLAQLEPDDSGDLTRASMLGFSARSWVAAYRALGPVFRVPELDLVVLSGGEATRSAWREPQDWSYASTPLGRAFRSQLGEGYITASDGDAHWDQRRLLQPYFNGENIQRHAALLARILDEGFAGLAGGPAELHGALIFLLTKGLNNSMVKTGASDAQIRDFARFEEEFIRGAVAADQDAWYGRPDYQALRSRVFDFFHRLVERRLAGETAGDNLDHLVAAMRERRSQRVDIDELVRDAYLMQAGGAGNIASMLCSLLWALLQQPEWLARVREELEGFDPAQLAAAGVNRLAATRAAILETERRYPPTPGMPKRTLRDLELMGWHIPAGTDIFHMFTLSHYLEEEYPEPERFDPGRWVEGATPRANAFGGGRHMCIGMNLAHLNILVGLKALLGGYALSAPRGPYLAPVEPGNPASPMCMAFDVRMQALPA